MAGQAPAAARTAPAGHVPASWDDVVRAIATREGVNPTLAISVMRKESTDRTTGQPNPNAIGDNGDAIGLFQLHEAAAADMGLSPEDRKDPIKNITGGIGYLKRLNQRYKGDVQKTLQAYNGGMKWVDEGTPTPEAQAYAADVIASLSQSVRAGAQQAGGAGVVVGRGTGAGPGGAGPGGRASGAGPGPAPGLIDHSMGSPTPWSVAKAVVEPYDPRNAEGRQNIAAMAGEIGAVAITKGLPVGAMTTRILSVLGPVLGAGVASSAEAATESALTGDVDLTGAAAAGGWQSAYALGGQTLLLPMRRLARSISAMPLATKTAQAIKDATAETSRMGRDAVRAVRAQVDGTLAAVRDDGTQLFDRTRLVQTQGTRAARQSGLERLAQIELQNAARVADVTKAYDDLLGQAPTLLGAGSAVRDTLEGPTKRALNLAGERVTAAAEKGPLVDFTPVVAQLNAMAAEARPAILYGADTADNGIGFLRNISAAKGQNNMAASIADPAALNAKIAAALGIPVDSMSPKLPALLGKIQSLHGQKATFADAHKIKRLLDQTVNWDKRSRQHLEQITKGLRQSLREQMRGYAPYDDATAAYEAVIPIYTMGVGEAILKAASTPGEEMTLALMLKGDDPAKALVLRQLLIDQADAGGDRAMGQRAWDAVRAAYTHENVVAGGIGNLDKRLNDLLTTRPEFVRVVYGDPAGAQVLKNLGSLSDAYKVAQQTADSMVTSTKAANRATTTATQDRLAQQTLDTKRQVQERLRTAKAQGRSRVEEAQDAAADANKSMTDTATRFKESTLYEYRNRRASDVAADVGRFGALGQGSWFGMQSLMRLLKSPNAADVLEWAAYSNYNTGRITKILTSPVTPTFAAGVFREIQGMLNGQDTPAVAPIAPTLLPDAPAAPAVSDPTGTTATAPTTPAVLGR